MQHSLLGKYNTERQNVVGIRLAPAAKTDNNMNIIPVSIALKSVITSNSI